MSDRPDSELSGPAPKLLMFTCEPPSYERYKYEKLPSPDSIRLVERHQHDETGAFYCSVHTYSIDQAPKYTALSYTWGEPAAPGLEDTELEMFCFYVVCDGHIHPITTNLYMALRRLTGTLFWIDQISINQEDEEEKASQVARMGTIFAKAEGVYVWLGEQNQADGVTFDIIRQFVPAWSAALENGHVDGGYVNFNDTKFWQIIGLPTWTEEQVIAIIQFFNRSWFRRTWIIQEIALADKTMVACGGLILPWRYLRSFSFFLSQSTWADTFLTKMLTMKELKLLAGTGDTGYSKMLPIGGVPSALGRLQDFCTQRYSRGVQPVDEAQNTIAQGQATKSEFYRLLESFLLVFKYSIATRGEDKVFAPLAITSQLLTNEETRANFFLPSYELSTVETYTEVCKCIIEGTTSLSILSQVVDQSIQITPGLPSWVPDFSVTSLPGQALGYSSSEIPLQRVFDALRDSTIVPRPYILGSRLHVQGIIWDTITKRGPNSEDEAFNRHPLAWLRMCLGLNPKHLQGQPCIEAFWRTMICDRTQNGQSPAPSELSSAFFAFVLRRLAGSLDADDILPSNTDNVNINRDIPIDRAKWSVLDELASEPSSSSPSPPPPSSPSPPTKANTIIPTLDFLTTFIALLNARDVSGIRALIPNFSQRVDTFHKLFAYARPFKRLFRTSRDVLGHGPVSLEQGDVVVFLVGSSVPFVLRPVDIRGGDDEGDDEGDGVRDRGDRVYRLVGEAYVHGLMRGEVLKEDDAVVGFQQLIIA